MKPVLIIVLLFPLLQLLPVVFSQHTIYHIKPTSESPCPYQDCLTLLEYTETSRYTNSNNLTLLFLPGEHVLNTSIEFQFLDSLSLLGNQSSLPNVTSKIICDGIFAFHLHNILSLVEIKALSLSNCGAHKSSNDYQSNSQAFTLSNASAAVNVIPAITALFLPNLHLDDCHFESNYLPLMLNKSRAYINGSTFTGNKGKFGGAMAAYGSSVVFLGQNTFLSNEALVGGGVFASDSSLLFNRSTTIYINNTAEYSGGTTANCSSAVCENATNLFSTGFHVSSDSMQELPQYSGGGILLIDSIMLQNQGLLNFIGNRADNGGEISSHQSHISLNGFAMFECNSATGLGGAMSVRNGTWHSIVIRFVGNSAETGGAVHVKDSELQLSTHLSSNLQIPLPPWKCISVRNCCQTLFKDNSATKYGGAIAAKRSFVMVSPSADEPWMEATNGYMLLTRVCFIGNNASRDGGGISLYNFSTLNITGSGRYISNGAGEFGGAIHAELNSHVTLYGENVYSGNCAGNGGGMALREASTAVLLGKTSMRNNEAGKSGGGVYLKNNSNLTVMGSGSFIHNVGMNGGAVRAGYYSHIVFSGENEFIDNHARYGGVLENTLHSSALVTGNFTFISNEVQLDGGGFCMTLSKAVLAGNGTWIGNTAGHSGGGLCMYGHTLDISGIGIYTNNTAVNGDGGVISAGIHRLHTRW